MGIIHCVTGILHQAVDFYEKAMNIKVKELGHDIIDVAQVSICISGIVLSKCIHSRHSNRSLILDS
jgi:hypothetical protein